MRKHYQIVYTGQNPHETHTEWCLTRLGAIHLIKIISKQPYCRFGAKLYHITSSSRADCRQIGIANNGHYTSIEWEKD